MDSKYRNIPLNPLRAFAIASQHQTFTAAANHMGVSQVAISRQIATLEDYLGITLFERNVRSVKLTDVGRAFSAEIAHHFDEIERLTERLFTVDGENTIDLRVYPTFAHQWLIPELGEFHVAYPDYKIRLDTKVEPLDFRGTHIDLALQLGHGVWSDSKSRKLFDEVIDVVCSPDYAAKFDNFKNPDAVHDAQLLHAKYRRAEWQIWAAEAGMKIKHRRADRVRQFSAQLRGSETRVGAGRGSAEPSGERAGKRRVDPAVQKAAFNGVGLLPYLADDAVRGNQDP